MPDEHSLTLLQVDQTRADFAAIEDDLKFVMGQLAELPSRRVSVPGIIACDRERLGTDWHSVIDTLA